MTESLPEPLTPADCDLRNFPWMELDVQRLLRSEWWMRALAEQPEACGPAVNFWAASWHEVPAASLPDADFVLWKLSQLERSIWDAVKQRVLAPWVKCSDGRLYHPVVAEKAIEAISKRKTASANGKRGNAIRWGSQPDRHPIATVSQGDNQRVATDSPPDRDPIAKRRAEKSGDDPKGNEQSGAEQNARGGFQVDKLDPALVVIEAFDQALTDAYGPERKRPFPIGTDIVHARRWLMAGYQPEDLYRLFLARQQARKAKGRDPIGSLSFFENAIAELGGSVPAASTGAAAPGVVRFMSPEAEIAARKAWLKREIAKNGPDWQYALKDYGLRVDKQAQEIVLTSAPRPEIPAMEATG